MGASAADFAVERVELHHRDPRCLLTLREKADAGALDGAGFQAWLDYEHEAIRWGVDPDVSRNELAALVEASTVAIGRDDHRGIHRADFARWGRRSGVATLERYGHAWFVALARHRHGRITRSQLEGCRCELSGNLA